MSQIQVIHWFRQDLRLVDNPALDAAARAGTVLPIFILDTQNPGDHAMGAASRVWCHHAFQSLSESLHDRLAIYQGDPMAILQQLCQQHDIQAVYWNRCYEPWRIQRDQVIKSELKAQEISVNTYNGSLLWEPWQVKKQDGTHYKVFTPFYRKGCLVAEPPRFPLGIPESLITLPKPKDSLTIDALRLCPQHDWHVDLISSWEISEQGGQNRLSAFVRDHINDYKQGRDIPSLHSTSRLSPYLHHGLISPNQAWYAARQSGDSSSVDVFCSELGWREFSYSQLYYNPTIATENLQTKFDQFPWLDDKAMLLAWQQGQTGIPMVDAGMRELYQTGYMHNRVRMIVGSFLVKNCLLHWHHGERWFWDCLFDADYASNSASWQWIAGCGADAAPFFRIFNPVTQGQKFDPEGIYIKQYCPELINMPIKQLHAPWEAKPEILQQAGIELGVDYPLPVVDLKISRQRALDAFKSLKKE